MLNISGANTTLCMKEYQTSTKEFLNELNFIQSRRDQLIDQSELLRVILLSEAEL